MSSASFARRPFFTSLRRRITQSVRQSSQMPIWKTIGTSSSGQARVAVDSRPQKAQLCARSGRRPPRGQDRYLSRQDAVSSGAVCGQDGRVGPAGGDEAFDPALPVYAAARGSKILDSERANRRGGGLGTAGTPRGRSFQVLLDPLEDFLAAHHLAVRAVDAIDLRMLAGEVSRVSEGQLLAREFSRFSVPAVAVAREDRPVRHCRSLCVIDVRLAATRPADCGLGHFVCLPSSRRAFSL